MAINTTRCLSIYKSIVQKGPLVMITTFVFQNKNILVRLFVVNIIHIPGLPFWPARNVKSLLGYSVFHIVIVPF